MVRNVYLYGDLEEKYGKVHCLAADSIADVINLMQVNHPDFRKHILPGRYAILRGESIDNYTDNLTEEQITMKFNEGDWHIVPEAVGAGAFAFFIAGALLSVGGYAIGLGTTIGLVLFQFGLGLALTGIAGMLTPVPDISDYSDEQADQKPSVVYTGGVNNVEQGGPVPIIYGECMAGSVLISSDVEIEEFADRDLGSPGDVQDFDPDA
jgi:predicted phage tail protein